MADEVEPDRLFRENANLYRMQKIADQYVTGIGNGPRFALTEPIIKNLHGVAMNGLLSSAGEYRDGPVFLKNCPYIPPPAATVRQHMRDLIAYLDVAWEQRDLIHLAAVVLWRLNWIHPFQNGNGRVARSASYLVLQAKHGKLLPPKNSVIQQIMNNKAPYYAALRHADGEADSGKPPDHCCLMMEQLLSGLLGNQLLANGL